MIDRADHWQATYSDKPAAQLSWYQREPTISRHLIETFSTDRSGAVIDIGAGESRLVDHLVRDGWLDVTVLDISERALTDVEHRLGAPASTVSFIAADVIGWTPDRSYDVWHDRAVFHFLTDDGERTSYCELVADAVRPHGIVVLGTFAPDGPSHCSGLPVSRYAPHELAAVFGASFSMIHHETEDHHTPHGASQPFTWVVLRRR